MEALNRPRLFFGVYFTILILIIFYSLSAFGKEYNCSYMFEEENFLKL